MPATSGIQYSETLTCNRRFRYYWIVRLRGR
jgi:hypothetical protein